MYADTTKINCTLRVLERGKKGVPSACVGAVPSCLTLGGGTATTVLVLCDLKAAKELYREKDQLFKTSKKIAPSPDFRLQPHASQEEFLFF
jgi:hypothetical protein